MTNVDIIGYIACGLVLITFCMNSLLRLRLSAVTSNVAFIAYAYFQELLPILLLHVVLLLINSIHLSGYAKQSASEKDH